MLKTITDKSGKTVGESKLTYQELYYCFKRDMPKDERWTVSTGKSKREYFWFEGPLGLMLSFIKRAAA